ncbi:GntR family transcriptional regulator [Citreicella sp. C3M06]|uniref:GntR family transcriptional regulator n=1 Tax=Citreicella sp. C3M06 TaxID=2841564 RepID=UPI001C09B470|nr:GntR family transcriptional regulator [Citreicella sp. C3M06]MBU2961299.1 GntR family transcriptional regulator [Citreicella sp. C3M06]
MHGIGPESKPQKIARLLEEEIRSGALHDGAALSSENALVERFAVSRATVRKGLGILSAKGLIQTRVGIGSFVTYGGAVLDNSAGWSISLSDSGARLGARIINIARIPMDLSAPGFDAPEVLALDRIRFREETGVALTLERSRVPWRDGFASILTEGLEEGSLSRTLENRNIVAASGEEWANVLPALSHEDALLLKRPAGSAMLRLRRLTRTASGEVMEYVESLLDPELFGLHMEF